MKLDTPWSHSEGTHLLRVTTITKRRSLVRGEEVVFTQYCPIKFTPMPEWRRDLMCHILGGGVLVDQESGTAYRFAKEDWQELRLDAFAIVEDNT